MAVINLSVSGEPIVHDAHGSLITTRLDTGSGAIGTTGDNVGVTATWLNAGTYNGQPISLRATILSVGDANDCVGFDTLGDDFIVLLTTNGSAENRTAATAVIKWDVLDADTKTPISGNVNVQIGDIDGIDGFANTRETVTASQDSLSSFTTSSSTSILVSAANNFVSASGTENNTVSPAPSNSYVGFTFSDTSSFVVTYTLAANSVTEQALFTHDGDFDISISGAVITSTPRIDLDGDNSSGPTGADFAARFVQGLARAAIVDTDVTMTSTGNLTGATVVLTNRQAGDDLAIGVLPTGITGTVDASDPAKVTVQLTGTASAADYQTALQAITFSNGSASGGEGMRAFEVSVAQNGIEGNVAKTALSVAPNLLLVDDTYAGIEDTLLLIDVLKNDTDADGDTLTITAINGIAIQPNNFVNIAGGRITLDPSGVLIFQPTVNSVTAPSFTYTVSDGQGHIAIASVNGTMTAVNDAPSSSSLSFSFSEDQSQIISVPHRDVDNDVLTITKINSTEISIDGSSVVIASGVITLNVAGNIIYTPTENYSGPYTFTYTLDDGHGLTSTNTVNGTIVAANDAPFAPNATFEIDEDNDWSLSLATRDVDGDAVTLTKIDGIVWATNVPQFAITGGVLTRSGADKIVFTPNADFSGDVTFTYTMDDARGLPSTGTVAGKVLAVNDLPVAPDLDFTVDEDGSALISLPLSDVDGDSVSIVAIDGMEWPAVGTGIAVAGGTVSRNAAGNLVFTPDADFNGTVSFSYQISDGAGGVATGRIDGTVRPVNDLPVLADDAGVTTEDTAARIDVVANDIDGDGDQLSIVAIDGIAVHAPVGNAEQMAVAHGRVSLNADGTLTFTPDANFNGTTSFTYTLSDGRGGTSTARVHVDVASVDDAPVATADSFTVSEDLAARIDVSANDMEPDGEALRIVSVNGHAISAFSGPVEVANGAVSMDAGGVLTFTPLPNFNGPISFTYEVADTMGNVVSGMVSGTVVAVNDAPVAKLDTGETMEDTPVVIDVRVNDTDTEGNALTVTTIDGVALADGGVKVVGGTVTLGTDGKLLFTPDTNFNGTSTFDYSVSDGAAIGGARVTVQVAPANDGPVVSPSHFIIGEDDTVELDLLSSAVDPEGDSLTVTQIDGIDLPASGVSFAVKIVGGTVSRTLGGTFLFTPDADFNGPVTIAYTVRESHGRTAVGQVSGTVTAANDAPVAPVLASFSTTEDTGKVISVPHADVDGDTVAVSQVDGQGWPANGEGIQVAGGVVTLNPAGNLVFTPDANFNGPISFAYTLSDGHGGTATGRITGTVTAVNDVPAAADDSIVVAEDTSFTIDVRTNDSDIEGDTLRVVAIDGIKFGSAENQEDDAAVPGATVQGPSIKATHGTVTLLADGTLSFTPGADFNGETSFTYTVSDGHGGTRSATVHVTVTPVNDAPIAANDRFSVAEDGTARFDLLANDSDRDRDSLLVTQINGTDFLADGTALVFAEGTFARGSDGLIVFTPTVNFNGPVSFTYTLSDSQGATATGTVEGTIIPVNDTPRAPDYNFAVSEDTSLTLKVPHVDIDGDTLTVSAIDGKAWPADGTGIAVLGGVVILDDAGEVVFTPRADFNGTVSFTYALSDGQGGTAIGHMDGTVTAINDGPSPADDSFTVAEDGSVMLDLLANDVDVDGDSLSLVEINGIAFAVGTSVAIDGGTLSRAGDGRVVFTAAADFNGDIAFTYTAVDGRGGRTFGRATGTVTPVNDVPVATDVTFSGREDQEAIIDLREGAVDRDGDALKVTRINGVAISSGAPLQAAGGSLTLAEDGTLRFTPAKDFNGDASFTFTLSDPSGAETTGRAVGSIAAVNDIPVSVDTGFTVEAGTKSQRIEVGAGGKDADGDTIRIAQIDGKAIAAGTSVAVAGGTVSLTADGNLLFTPLATFSGQTRFSYMLSDDQGGTSTAMLSGQVKAVEAWANFGTELDKVLNEFGLAKPNDLNDLLAAASFLAPGAVSAAGAGTAGMGGYHAAAGYDLDLTTATPDVDLLTDALATLINGKTYFNTPAPLSADGAGAYKSADDQSLLFQIYLKSDMVIDLDQGETATAYAGTASAQNAWSKAFAQKVLNADISADEVTSFDHQSQAKLIEAIVEKDAALSVKLDGIQTSASKSVLANPYGAEFVSADGTSAVEVARSVAIAETAAAADDQTAMVRMRQSGTKDLSVMFYKVDDLSGTVGGFKPGEAGYDAASTAHAYKTDTGMTWVSGGGYGKYSEANLTDVDAGDLIAMKLSNGETTFYAFANANEVVNDAHVAHLWSYGLNTWGWEDLYGGGDTDFNDLVVKLDFLPTAHDQVL